MSFKINAGNLPSLISTIRMAATNKTLYLKFAEDGATFAAIAGDVHLMGTLGYLVTPEEDLSEPLYAAVDFNLFQNVLNTCARSYRTNLTEIEFGFEKSTLKVTYTMEHKKGTSANYDSKFDIVFSSKEVTKTQKERMIRAEYNENDYLTTESFDLIATALLGVMTESGASSKALFTKNSIYVAGNIRYALNTLYNEEAKSFFADDNSKQGYEINKKLLGVLKTVSEKGKKLYLYKKLTGPEGKKKATMLQFRVADTPENLEGGINIAIRPNMVVRSYEAIKPGATYEVDRQQFCDVLNLINAASMVGNGFVYLEFVNQVDSGIEINCLKIHTGSSERLVFSENTKDDVEGSVKELSTVVAKISPSDLLKAIFCDTSTLVTDENRDEMKNKVGELKDLLLKAQENPDIDYEDEIKSKKEEVKKKDFKTFLYEKVEIKVGIKPKQIDLIFSDGMNAWRTWTGLPRINSGVTKN